MPVVQLPSAIVDTSVGDETHWSVGVNYWWVGHNANVKAAYGRVAPVARNMNSPFSFKSSTFEAVARITMAAEVERSL